MLYLTWLCGFLLLFILLCFAIIMRKRLSRQMLLGICITTFVISVLFPLRYVLCNPFLKERVSVTALREKNEASQATDVIIQYIDTNLSERRIENPVEGKWAWWNGVYVWFDAWEQMGVEPTDTVIFELPVGNERSIVFSIGPRSGRTEISCMGISQKVDLYSEVDDILSVQLPSSEHGDYEKDILLRALFFAGITVLIIILATIIIAFLNKKTSWRGLLRWRYEGFVFLLSFINIILIGKYPYVYDYSITYYFLPYERGFGARGLQGTLAALFGGPYIGVEGLTTYIFGILILTYLFGAILIVRLAKKESDWRMGVFWVLFYLLIPLTFMEIFDDTRPDLYLIILFIVGAVLINKKRFIQLFPVLCVLMILLNETSSLFFVGSLLAMLLYCAFKEKDIGCFISFLSSAAFTCVATLGIIRLDIGKLMPMESYFAHMSLHTDAPLHHGAFNAEYTKGFSSILSDFAYSMGDQAHRNHELLIRSILYLLLIIPFAILLVILWKTIYKKIVDKYKGSGFYLSIMKILCWIMLLSSCGGLICALLAYDYNRFTMFIMIASMANIFTLIHKEKLVLQVSDLYLFVPSKRNIPIFPFAVLMYMNFWGTIGSWGLDTQFLINLSQILKDFLGFR